MNDNSYQIPITPGNPFGLGRHVHHDPQNFLTQHLALIQPPVRQRTPNRTFPRGLPYDQGDSPSCTIHAAVGLCRSTPNATSFTGRSKYDSEDEMRAAYEESKQYDPWPGSDYDGTSSDAPYKLLRARGEIASWKWLKGETEVREWLTWYGPCTLGTVWLNDMFYPDENGYLTVSGSVAGGHEYELVQYSATRDAYRVVNSWGTSWGQNGRAWLRSKDVAALLDQDGDAVTVGV